jgi:hypothetical protein
MKIKDFQAAKDMIQTPMHDLPYALSQHNKTWTIISVIVNDYNRESVPSSLHLASPPTSLPLAVLATLCNLTKKKRKTLFF